MATTTDVAIGLFSEMLDERLRNNGKYLDRDAIALLDAMQTARATRLRADRGLQEDEELDPPIVVKVSLDQVLNRLLAETPSNQAGVTLYEIRRIIDFFCPGLPPIC